MLCVCASVLLARCQTGRRKKGNGSEVESRERFKRGESGKLKGRLRTNTHTHRHTHKCENCWMCDRSVFKSQGRVHNKARSTHMDTHTHACSHTASPLPGHFALERAEKLMRVQSFITLETERERERERKRERGERESEGNPVSSLLLWLPWEPPSHRGNWLLSFTIRLHPVWTGTQLIRTHKHAKHTIENLRPPSKSIFIARLK